MPRRAEGSSRWYAILIGIPLLVWASRGLLGRCVVVHRLIWGDPRGAASKATLAYDGFACSRLLLVYFRIRELARCVGSWTGSSP